jgi:putative endonuclease
MTRNKRSIGNVGEDIAARFLANQGFEIIERNYRYERSEVDIVARDSNVLVFVEVKARRSRKFGEPEDAVTERKRKRLLKVAEGYLYEHKIENVECRFDVLSIFFHGGETDIKHIKNAF